MSRFLVALPLTEPSHPPALRGPLDQREINKKCATWLSLEGSGCGSGSGGGGGRGGRDADVVVVVLT